MKNYCIYGGQWGSEGKGSFVEHLVNTGCRIVTAIGEGSPNSGHTCSKGSLRQLPTASWWAEQVFIGPDACIDIAVLADDIGKIVMCNPDVKIFIHAHAGYLDQYHVEMEQNSSLKERIGSTVTGSGACRYSKQSVRDDTAIVGHPDKAKKVLSIYRNLRILTPVEWFNALNERMSLIEDRRHYVTNADATILEVNQGTMLDNSWGNYPYVTSRSTLPDVAIARNGLSVMSFYKVMVCRTYPIRTGGNSGPAGDHELSWEQIGVKPEISTVTKRVRRVFQLDPEIMHYAIHLTRPRLIAWTHLDYLMPHGSLQDQIKLLKIQTTNIRAIEQWGISEVYSNTPGKFDHK